MKLLMVSACLPGTESGASARNYNLLKALALKHTVSLLALADQAEPAEIARVAEYTDSIQLIAHQIPQSKRWRQLLTAASGRSYLLNLFYVREVQSTLDRMFAQSTYDAVIFESVFMAGYRVPAGVEVIIDQHNLEHELLGRTYKDEKAWSRKLYGWQEYRQVRRAELERCRQADLILVTSERERYLLKGLLPKQMIETVPNGVDIEAFQPAALEKEASNQIIFTGTMNYYPNIKAMLFFVAHCWPRIRAELPSAQLLIVGKNPPSAIQRLAEQLGVVVTGRVPDIRPYLEEAMVAIAPLQIGSGTRLKILEALAMRKAVVSTVVGCEGLAVTAGEHLLVKDQADDFAASVIELLRDPARRRALGDAGRALVEREYSWERCGARLLEILDRTYQEGV